MQEPIGKAYKPYLIGSVVVLVTSLVMLAALMTIAFLDHSGEKTPLWVIALSVVAILGVIFGFGGFFGMMLVAGWQSYRESRRVQVLPPER